MPDSFVTMGVGLCILMFLTLVRAFRGPTAIDRIIGVNVIGTKTTVLLVIIGIVYGRVDMFVDISLAYALLNFIATLAAARYFQHHKELRETGFFLRKRDRG